jgi:hypothetical protein
MIKKQLSMVYHSQTNSQSEALNRIMEDYLWAYYADEPTSQINLLPLARFVYNLINIATKLSPHNLLFGIDCNIQFYLDEMPKRWVPETQARIECLHELRGKLQTYLAETNKQMAKYYNQKHMPKQFKRGQLVKLSTRNLKLKYLKLTPR